MVREIIDVIRLTPTSKMIYSKENFQINAEYFMFNTRYLGK